MSRPYYTTRVLMITAITLFTNKVTPSGNWTAFFDIRESAVTQSPSCSLLSRVRMPTTLLPRLHILFMLFLWFSGV